VPLAFCAREMGRRCYEQIRGGTIKPLEQCEQIKHLPNIKAKTIQPAKQML